MSLGSNNTQRSGVLKIVVIYTLFGCLWIYCSDTVLGWVIQDPAVLTQLAIFKGTAFIAITSALLYILIKRFILQDKQSSDELHTIIQTTKDGFYISDTSGQILEANSAYCGMIGYSRDELIGMNIQDLEARELPEEVTTHIQQVIQSGSANFESQHRCKNGQIIDIDASVTYVATPVGRFYSFIRDISERKQSEIALQQSHSMLNNLAQQVPGILFKTCLHPDGQMETPYASGNSYIVYELSPEEIQADISCVFERIHPDDRERVTASVHESARSLTRWECEYRALLPQQGLKWLFGTAQPQLLENGTIVLYGIIMDISERRHVDEMLRLKDFSLGNIADAIYWITPDARIWDVNHAAEKMLGYTHEQFLSMTVSDVGPVFPAEQWPAHWEELKRHGSLQFETTHQTIDGRNIPVEVTANYCRYNDLEFNCAIARDISDRREMQEERIKGQKLESLGVLAGGIAHDFNNILTGIMGNISYARMFVDESNRAAKILEQAEKASQRASDLAHQLLTFAKGSQPIKKSLSVRQIIEASSALVLHGSNVQSSIHIPDNLADIEADEGQISQACTNIIINAAQAMPGGGSIHIRAENFTLDSANLMALSAGKYVKLTFTDSGCGISAEELQKIFDPYFTTKPSGNGLGLASVYSIINKHSGHISVRSMVGKGTTFDILLPASNQQAIEPERTKVAITSGTNHSVLIMDDEELIRDLTSAILGELGYMVQTCSNGSEAVALYAAAHAAGIPFSAVVMDLTIPGGMGGKEAAELILHVDPQARLIVSSGYSNDPIMSDFNRFGFCATMIKPYTMDDIARVLSEQLH